MQAISLAPNWAGKDTQSLAWLASYPRSGNTFTRLLLANYFLGTGETYDINELHNFLPADTSKLVWEGYCAQAPAVPHTLEEVWKARPAAFRHYRETKDPKIFPCLKSHTINSGVFDTIGFDFRPGDRALYIVRHPLDVLLSFADFNDLEIGAAIDLMCLEGSALYADQPGRAEIRGSWVQHVSSWLDSPPCPLHLIRYEELCTDTEAALKSILTFLGVPILPERVKKAVEASSIDKARAQEARHSFIERPDGTQSGTFFREGKTLQWLRRLDPAAAHRLADACNPLMERLGYAHPRDVLFDGRNALKPVAL